jgi:hypothetical protein
VTAPLDVPGESLVLTIDLVTVINGRAIVDTSFSNAGSQPFDPGEELRLTQLVVSRLPSNL